MTTNAVLFLGIVLLAVVHARVLDHHNMKNIHDECQSDPATKIDELASRSGGHEVQNLGAHTFCMISKVGLLTDNGDVNKEVLKEYITKNSHHDAAKVDEIVSDCGKREGVTPVEAAVGLKKCLRKYEAPDNHNNHHRHHHH